MNTDENRTGSDKVQKLQSVFHGKTKGAPGCRFHTLCDRIWRKDVLREACKAVRRNRGIAGVDGESFETIEKRGAEEWLGEWSQERRENTYSAQAVLEVRIPKKEAGQYRALGIPGIRDRVAQTSGRLVLGPIFEADLRPEQ